MDENTLIIGTSPNFVSFEVQKFYTEYPYVSCLVSVSVENRSGRFEGKIADNSFTMWAIDDFLTELDRLDTTRQGEARMKEIADVTDSCSCRFKLFALDQLGHIAVEVQLLQIKYMGNRAKLYTSTLNATFEVDAGSLGMIGDYFRSVRAQWT